VNLLNVYIHNTNSRKLKDVYVLGYVTLDFHGSVHHNTNCIEIYNVILKYMSLLQHVKPEAAITVFELLMMSGVSLKTC